MQKTIQQISVSKSVMNELKKMPKWEMMMYLQQNGETPAYKIAKELGWTTGKVHALVKSLEASKAVEASTRLVNNRAVKFVKLVA